MHKNLKNIFLILSFVLISCNKKSDKRSIENISSDTTNRKVENPEQTRIEKRKKIEEENKKDSVFNEKILLEALRKVELKKNLVNYKSKYQTAYNNDFGVVTVEIDYDFHFSNKNKHLIIRRLGPAKVLIDIYLKKNNVFKKVISHDQWSITYVNDTIKDVNGDNKKDFIINWYGASGCCLKAFSNVYLQRKNAAFSKDFEFINPTFSSKDKTIIGVCYGHPGETELYKYQWNKESVDTIEFIYFEKNFKGEKTGKYISSNKPPNCEKLKKERKINSLPKEYLHIEGIDWFIGNK